MPGRRRQAPEAALHRQVAAFLRVALPDDAVWTTFPAGGGGRIRGAQLKAAGLMAGWPDIQVVYDRQLICFELKAPKGRLSVDQVKAIERIGRAGGSVFIVRQVEQVEQALRDWGVPLRASLGRAA